MPNNVSPRLVYSNGRADAQDSSITVDGGADNVIFHDGNFLIFHDGNFVVFHHPVNPEQGSVSPASKNVSPRLVYSGQAEL